MDIYAQEAGAGQEIQGFDDDFLTRGVSEEELGKLDSGEQSLEELFGAADEDSDKALEAMVQQEGGQQGEPGGLAGLAGQDGGVDTPDAADAQQGAQGLPTGANQQQPDAGGRRFTVWDGQAEREINVADMSDDVLRELISKGFAYDGLREQQDRATYQRVYQEQIEAGTTEAVARMVARDATGGRDFPLDGGQQGVSQQQGQQPGPQGGQTPGPWRQPGTTLPRMPPARDLRGEVEQLRTLFPDVKEIPDEVARAVNRGVSLPAAYQAYSGRQAQQRMEALERENAVLRQNQANSARAPVRGASGGGAVSGQGKSIFEQGFDAGLKW